MVRIVIPGQMRGKGRPRFTTVGRFARAFTDAKTASAESWVKACAIEAGASLIEGPVAVHIAIAVETPASWSKRKRRDALAGVVRPTGKPDLDNCMKLIADALNGIAWRDDSQIVRVSAEKHFAEVPQTVLEIEPVVTPQAPFRMAVPVEPVVHRADMGADA